MWTEGSDGPPCELRGGRCCAGFDCREDELTVGACADLLAEPPEPEYLPFPGEGTIEADYMTQEQMREAYDPPNIPPDFLDDEPPSVDEPQPSGASDGLHEMTVPSDTRDNDGLYQKAVPPDAEDEAVPDGEEEGESYEPYEPYVPHDP